MDERGRTGFSDLSYLRVFGGLRMWFGIGACPLSFGRRPDNGGGEAGLLDKSRATCRRQVAVARSDDIFKGLLPGSITVSILSLRTILFQVTCRPGQSYLSLGRGGPSPCPQ